MKFLKIFEKKGPGGFDYDQWITAAEIELATKQAALTDAFNLGQWTSWNADLAAGKIFFSDESGVRVVGEVQIVGSRGSKDWLWAWANTSLPAAFVQDSALAKAFGDEHGIEELSQASVTAADLEPVGWRLTAAVVRLSDAIGAYSAPTGTGALLLAIKTLTRV
ncbi:DUF6882 domain-containing protein [Brevundimonas poindexterae]|uniref:DUF6882 domain-containing protein n=1 Tax=Brevundimonas poindexterae TaxID=74325 RepID=UPI001CFEB6BA|nr:DUF6882 domain-containing protein [Brevundimonas poindexterae]